MTGMFEYYEIRARKLEQLMKLKSFRESTPRTQELKLNRAVIVLPIVGYNTNLDDFPLMKPLFKELIKQEEIDMSIYNGEILRDLEFKGTFRAMTIKPVGLKVNELTDDKAFPSKMKLKIEFSLPKGCYATMLLREIIK